MNTRLKQFLAAENITQAQFADKINVVRASVSHILSGRNNPSFDFIKAMMIQYPRLNMEWLMFGKGKMYKDSGSDDTEHLFSESPQVSYPAADAENPVRIRESAPEIQESESGPAISAINTLNNSSQPIVKQRKILKIIVMYDDGSFQEL